MIRNGVTIDDTFAEAFPMKGTRLVSARNVDRRTFIRAAKVSGSATALHAPACRVSDPQPPFRIDLRAFQQNRARWGSTSFRAGSK